MFQGKVQDLLQVTLFHSAHKDLSMHTTVYASLSEVALPFWTLLALRADCALD